jgi:hypothetical protein
MADTTKQKRKPSAPTARTQDSAPTGQSSLKRTKTLLAQFYLHDVEEELTEIRQTMQQHRVALRELRKGGDLVPSFVRDLLAVLVHRDRRLATRLANVHATITEAICLLAAANDADPAPAKN